VQQQCGRCASNWPSPDQQLRIAGRQRRTARAIDRRSRHRSAAVAVAQQPRELSDFTEAVRVATIVLSFDLVGYIVFFY
jgi:hypothetical protein